MSGTNTIGTGALILTASADSLVAGLDKAEAKVKGYAASVAEAMKKSGDIGGGPLGASRAKALDSLAADIDRSADGLRTRLATMGLSSADALVKSFKMRGATPEMLREVSLLAKGVEDAERRVRRVEFLRDVGKGLLFGIGIAGPLTAVLAAAERLGSAVRGWAVDARRFSEELDRAARLNEKLGKVQDRGLRRADEFLGAQVTPGAKLAEVSRQLDLIGREFTAKNSEAEGLRKKLGDLKDFWSAAGWHESIIGGLEQQIKATEQALNAAQAAAVKYDDKLADLREHKGRLLNPANDPALLGDINRQLDEVYKQFDTLGLSAGEAMVEGFRRRGASAEMLAELEHAARAADIVNAVKGGPHLSGAFERGSTEAYSVVARARGNSILADVVPKQILEEHRKGNARLDRIAAALEKAAVIRGF